MPNHYLANLPVSNSLVTVDGRRNLTENISLSGLGLSIEKRCANHVMPLGVANQEIRERAIDRLSQVEAPRKGT